MDRVLAPTSRLRGALEGVVAEVGPDTEVSDVQGFTLVAIGQGSWHRRFLPAIRDAAMVVGRHTECELSLHGDPTVSLRHLLLRAIRLEDGTPALRVLDLETPLGFGIEDGTPVRSIVATGPFAIALGEWVVVGVPHGPLPPVMSGGAGPYRIAAPELHLSHQVPRRVAGDARRSHITLLPAASSLIAAPQSWGVRTMKVRRGHREAQVGITDDALERGILIGRYDRCITGGLREILTHSISRAHALILRNEGEDRIYDLASTQGIYIKGKRVKSATLPRRGAKIRLGVETPVELVWPPTLDA
jgi:hypothetical protein